MLADWAMEALAEDEAGSTETFESLVANEDK